MAEIRLLAGVVAGVLLVAGCNSTTSGGATSGSSSGGSTSQVVNQIIGSSGLTPADYATAYTDLTNLADTYQPTATSDLPSGSSVSYAGVVTLSLPSGGGTVLGDLSLDVDFDGQTFDGGVDDFVDTNLVTLTGSLDFVGGALTAGSLSADADGTAAGLSLDYTVTGSFLGTGAAAAELTFASATSGGVGVAEKH